MWAFFLRDCASAVTIEDMFLIDQHVRILKRFLFLLIPYSLLRIGFYFYHLSTYKQFSQDQIFESLILGIRFDVAAICLLNVPILLLALIPGRNSLFIFFERMLFVLINGAGIIASLDDYELFSFMGKRLSLGLFVITEDILEQLPQLAIYYWYFPLLGVLFSVGFYYFDRKFFEVGKKESGIKTWIFSSVFMLAWAFVGIRGGLQHKSINVQSAFTQGENELGHLVLNTPYHFLRTLKNKPIEKLRIFKTDEEALNVIVNRRDLRPVKAELNKKNVILIILESFSSEYVEEGYTPFLTELMKEGASFQRHLANGRRSIEVLPSVLCGLPSLLADPISKSSFSGNKFSCLPKLLKEHGYANVFFHGGSKGTMGFEAYTLATGFDRYYSKDDYKGKEVDGTWGVFDEPYLEFAADEILKLKEPFLAGVFTLSSHQPFAVPEKYKGKFPKGTLEIHESIGYADYSLRKFFERMRKAPWFSNTLFILTADHTSMMHTKKFKNLVGYYRVPLVILNGGEWDTSKVSQHSDIPRTITEFLGVSSDSLPATSANLKSPDAGFAMNFADGQVYYLASGNEVIGYVKGQPLKRYEYDWESGVLTLKGESKDELLPAYLQYFFNGLISNNLSIYR